MENDVIAKYRRASKRLLLLDYDGVLVPIAARPEQAKPGEGVRELLTKLSLKPGNKCVIVSGRGRESLENWLGDLPIDIIAEHGLWRKTSGNWTLAADVDLTWKDDICAQMQLHAQKLPGALIEEKFASLAFHYRCANTDDAKMAIERLMLDLQNILPKSLRLLHGKKVVEVLTKNTNKGSAIKPLLTEADWDFIMAAGDDVTDESLFSTLPKTAHSIKIGRGQTSARFQIDTQAGFNNLLTRMTDLYIL